MSVDYNEKNAYARVPFVPHHVFVIEIEYRSRVHYLQTWMVISVDKQIFSQLDSSVRQLTDFKCLLKSSPLYCSSIQSHG